MYDFFNKTFWRKVDAYGRDKMERDLKKLRKQREEQKFRKKTNPTLNAKYRSVPPNVDDYNHKVYEKIKGNIWNDVTMTETLRKKIILEDTRLTSQQAKDIAEYMIQNKGGCPV